MLLVMWVAMNSSTSGGGETGSRLGLLVQDRQPGLEIGRVDLGDQAHLEPAAQPILEGRDGIGRAIRGQHDLVVGLVERVEGVEELLLETLTALEELDVVERAGRRPRGSAS